MHRAGLTIPLLSGSGDFPAPPRSSRIGLSLRHRTCAGCLQNASVVQRLLSEHRASFLEETKERYRKIGKITQPCKYEPSLLLITPAAIFSIDWNTAEIAVPKFLGIRSFDGYPLAELISYRLEFLPQAVGDRRRVADILPIRKKGAEAALLDDVMPCSTTWRPPALTSARAVFGIFRATRSGTTTSPCITERYISFEICASNRLDSTVSVSFSFIAPHDSGRTDHIGAFALTANRSTVLIPFRERRLPLHHGEDHAIAWRKPSPSAPSTRQDQFWGYAPENLGKKLCSANTLASVRLRAILLPEHSEKRRCSLADAEKNRHLLTESWMMMPAASVCGWYYAIPRPTIYRGKDRRRPGGRLRETQSIGPSRPASRPYFHDVS